MQPMNSRSLVFHLTKVLQLLVVIDGSQLLLFSSVRGEFI